MRYPELVLEEKINGLNVNLVGVCHSESFFQEHEAFFREQIRSSPAVFLEDVDRDFSERIAKVAQETSKSIYVLESGNIIHIGLDATQLCAGLYLASSYLIKPKEMSRRNFLKKGGATLLGLYLIGGSFVPRSFVQKAIGNEDIKLDDALQYGTVEDYRNIVAAENIDMLSRLLKVEGHIPYFIGANHVEGIHTYLQNSKLRKKRLVYFIQDIMSDTSIRKYEFQDSNWKLTEKI
jgi:hypothetical protein